MNKINDAILMISVSTIIFFTFITIGLVIRLTTKDINDCRDRTRSDLDYCICYPDNCKPSPYKPKK